MNASDIVNARKNKVLYKAYYNPVVFASSIFSTITVLSSIVGADPAYTLSTSYSSSISSCNTYACNPTFVSYEMAQNVANGQYACGSKKSELKWVNNASTMVYAYDTNLGPGPTVNQVVTDIYTQSTLVSMGPMPNVCSDTFRQGNNSKC
jgi:hypothetical protein